MLEHLKANNRNWARNKIAADPGFFQRLARQQAPEYLWIGCADSRVPANEIVDLDPGELFVHRNVANLAPPQDANYLSVLQFAVDVLMVKHIIVVGHYGCSGVQAAMRRSRVGLADNWLRHVQDVHEKHQHSLVACASESAAADRLCELNVIEQVANVGQTTVVQDAWNRGQELAVHGWVYGLDDGLVRDLRTTVSTPAEASATYHTALAAL
jgi:carbonic anhydrase